MNITIQYSGYLKKMTGRKNEIIAINDGDTIQDVQERLIACYGSELFTRGRSRMIPVILINGTRADERTLLNDQDQVSFYYFVTGG